MRHLHAGRKLGVLPDHRRALMRSLALALIERDRIQTTPARAKAIRPFAERLVTLAKRGDLHSRRRMVQLLGSTGTNGKHNRVRSAIQRVYTDLAPRFKTRNGGYTQIFRLAGGRAGDHAPQCLIQFIPGPEEGSNKKSAGQSKESKSDIADKKTKKLVGAQKDSRGEEKVPNEQGDRKVSVSKKTDNKAKSKKEK